MPSVTLHPRPDQANEIVVQSELPSLLRTPSGLAILEIQGQLNTPAPETPGDPQDLTVPTSQTPVGRLVFPLYNANALETGNTAWMRRVFLYVGKHQRMTGEVKKLPKPFAVVRKREMTANGANEEQGTRGSDTEELEIAEIVHYKIVFANRPEPVGD